MTATNPDGTTAMARKKGRSGPPPASDPRIPGLLEAAGAQLGAGRAEAAEALVRQVLALAPRQPDALHLMGLICHRSARAEEAARWLRKAASAAPNQALFAFHLGEVLREQGQYNAALRAYQQALAAAPGLADAHFARGSLLLEQGQHEPAAAALGRAVELAPEDPEAWNNLGNARSALGRRREAVAAYRRALELRSGYRDARENLARTLLDWGRWEEAAAAARALLAAERRDAGAALLLARALERAGDPQAALAALAEINAGLDSPRLTRRIGELLESTGQAERAAALYRETAAREPEAAWWARCAGALEQAGQRAEAAAAYRKALEHDSDHAPSLEGLARVAPEAVDPAHRRRLEQGTGDRRRPAAERAALTFAMAGLREREGALDQAFELYQRGNALVAADRPFDGQAFVAFTDALIKVCDRDWLNSMAVPEGGGARPVLIVGMPRSGTTLVERILAAHAGIHPGGEREDFLRLFQAVPGWLECDEPLPEVLRRLDPGRLAALRRHYGERLARACPLELRLTDKLPGNYLRLGLVAALAPGARVVHLSRDPMDVGLSCFVTRFRSGQNWSFDLGHIGLVYREYARLMDHWRAVRPLPMLELAYEDLVADPEPQVRRLLDFLDLPWESACLDFHRQATTVRTASLWQVRQPLYASSVGRWRRYARHLEPLRRALGDLAPE